jgi:hypothetical protein
MNSAGFLMRRAAGCFLFFFLVMAIAPRMMIEVHLHAGEVAGRQSGTSGTNRP